MSSDREHLSELAALYAAGALTPEKALDFERALAGDEELRSELEELQHLVGFIGHVVEPHAPPPELKERLLDRVRSLPRREAAETGSAFIVRREDSGFRDTGADGVESKILYASPRRITLLLRAKPGSSLPSHGHVMLEECFVLEGDLEAAGGETLRVGDYQVMEPGSVHSELRSREGCLVLLTFTRAG